MLTVSKIQKDIQTTRRFVRIVASPEALFLPMKVFALERRVEYVGYPSSLYDFNRRRVQTRLLRVASM